MLVILKITLIFTVLTCVVFIRLNNPILYYLYLLIILKYLVQHLFLLNLKSGTKRLGYSLMINFKRNFWCQKNHIATQIFVKKYRNQNYVEFFFRRTFLTDFKIRKGYILKRQRRIHSWYKHYIIIRWIHSLALFVTIKKQAFQKSY